MSGWLISCPKGHMSHVNTGTVQVDLQEQHPTTILKCSICCLEYDVLSDTTTDASKIPTTSLL